MSGSNFLYWRRKGEGCTRETENLVGCFSKSIIDPFPSGFCLMLGDATFARSCAFTSSFGTIVVEFRNLFIGISLQVFVHDRKQELKEET